MIGTFIAVSAGLGLVIFGPAAAFIAHDKGRDVAAAFALGFLLGIIGLLIVGFLQPRPDKVAARAAERAKAIEQNGFPPEAEGSMLFVALFSFIIIIVAAVIVVAVL